MNLPPMELQLHLLEKMQGISDAWETQAAENKRFQWVSDDISGVS